MARPVTAHHQDPEKTAKAKFEDQHEKSQR